jgi:hypothetical protein
MNKQLPPIEVYVRNSFILKEDDGDVSLGYLIGARALQNQALQFQVLLSNGALFTGLPAHAICFEKTAQQRTLQECQHWDNISSDIDVIVYDTLLYMPCTVKIEPNGEILKGEYLFTIDYVGSNDLSRNPTHWKMFHAIRSEEGNLHLYAQYRIKFTDTALCYRHKEDFPEYIYNENIWKVGC